MAPGSVGALAVTPSTLPPAVTSPFQQDDATPAIRREDRRGEARRARAHDDDRLQDVHRSRSNLEGLAGLIKARTMQKAKLLFSGIERRGGVSACGETRQSNTAPTDG